MEYFYDDKHLEMNKISVLNNPQRVDMPLNKLTKVNQTKLNLAKCLSRLYIYMCVCVCVCMCELIVGHNSSDPEQDCLHGLINFGMATILGEGKLWMEANCRPGVGWALPSY